MTIEELKEIVDVLAERHPGADVITPVKDYYSRYGEDANFSMSAGETKGTLWHGIAFNGHEIRLDIRLSENSEGKKPKITYRK